MSKQFIIKNNITNDVMLDQFVVFIKNYLNENSIKLNNELDKNKLVNDICESFIKFDTILETILTDHCMYPLVSTKKGRPHLNWNKCAHHNCSTCFGSGDALRIHLEEKKCFKHFYSKSHEECPVKYNFKDGNYNCMSSQCNFQTSNESLMIQHYRLLGITPFFKIGDVITLDEYKDFSIKLNHEQIYNKLKRIIINILNLSFQNKDDVCCCCLIEKPNIILNNCYHCILCSNCINKISNKRCPICKQNFEKYINFDDSLLLCK